MSIMLLNLPFGTGSAVSAGIGKVKIVIHAAACLGIKISNIMQPKFAKHINNFK